MDREDQAKDQIKVIDRRRFTSEGEAREGVEDRAPKRDLEAEAAKVAAQAPPKKDSVQLGATPTAAEDDVDDEDLPEDEGAASGPDFSSLVVSLATQTLVMLGLMPNPETNLVSESLDGAGQLMGILKMLKLKTRKKLTRQESELLDQVLSELTERAQQSGVPDYGISELASLVESLAAQTMMLLGVLKPGDGPATQNFDAAKYTVDILGMLETKTEGNLTPKEAQLLKEVLRQLRLEFAKRVTATKSSQ